MTGRVEALRDLGLYGGPPVSSCDSKLVIFMASGTLVGPIFAFSRMDGNTSDAAPPRGMQCILYAWRFHRGPHVVTMMTTTALSSVGALYC